MKIDNNLKLSLWLKTIPRAQYKSDSRDEDKGSQLI